MKVAIVVVARGEHYTQMAQLCERSARDHGFEGDFIVREPLHTKIPANSQKPSVATLVAGVYQGLIICDCDVIFVRDPMSLVRDDGRIWFGRGRKVTGANSGLGYIPFSCRDALALWAYYSLAFPKAIAFHDQGWLNVLAKRAAIPLSLYEPEVVRYSRYGETATAATVAYHAAGHGDPCRRFEVLTGIYESTRR
jgi:hypothetical protein